MLNSLATWAGAVLLCATPLRVTRGQESWGGTDRVDAMLHAVVNALEPEIAAALSSPEADPLRIIVTSPDSVRWHAVLDRLRVMLGAHEPARTDRLMWILELEERERSDSGSTYTLTVGRQTRCPGSNGPWSLNSRAATIVVRQRARYWEATQDQHPVMLDPGPCA